MNHDSDSLLVNMACTKVRESEIATVESETLTSGNFGESGSNHHTLTFQSKATKENKHLQIICYLILKVLQYKAKISTFTSISSMFLLSKFFESGFTQV